jgi:CheY-like chemotaxis protein
MQTNGGRLLLILTSRAAETTTQLIRSSGLSPADTLRELHRLVDQGFIVAVADDGAVGVYRLNPKGVRTDQLDPQQRILVIEDDLAIQQLTVLLLEEEGYAVNVTQTPADATALLKEVAFDLVLTDGFSATARAVLTNTTDIRETAGVTPVVLFTAHHMELDAVRAVGFRDLIEKPFELETLEQTVRTLVGR